jgi:outer membrane protein assembly factor BamB
MNLLTIPLLGLLLAGCAATQHAVAPNVAEAAPPDVIWSGTVELRESLHLPRGTRLIVEPGTTVRFANVDKDGDGWGDVSLLIEGGELVARGRPDAPILFTSEAPPATPGSWGEIRIDFGRVDLSHAIVEGSTRGLHIHFSSGSLADSIFRDNVDGTRIGESKIAVSRCLFANQSGKGFNSRASTNRVEGNWFRGNRNGVFLFEGDEASTFAGNRFTRNDTPFRLGDFYEGTVDASGNEWDREPSDFRAEGNDTAKLVATPGPVGQAGPGAWPLLKTVWSLKMEGFVDADPVADESGIYAADWGGRLVRLGFLDGRVLAQTRLGDVIDAGLCFYSANGKNRLAVMCWDRTVSLLDAETLAVLDRFEEEKSPSDDHRQAAPVYDGGRLYVGTWAGKMRAFDVSGDRLQPLWTFAAERGFRAPPLVLGGKLLAPCEDGKLYALDATSGKPVWTFDAGAPLVSALAVTGKTLFAGDRAGILHALDVRTGKPLWAAQPGAPLWHAPPLVWQSSVIQADDAGNLAAYNATDGKVLWKTKLHGPVRSRPTPVGQDFLAVAGLDGSVSLVRASDGSLSDRVKLEGALHTTPAVQGNRLYLGGRDGVFYALDIIVNVSENKGP